MKEYYVITCGLNIEFIIQIVDRDDYLIFAENKMEHLRSEHYKLFAYREDYPYDAYKDEYQWRIELCKGV